MDAQRFVHGIQALGAESAQFRRFVQQQAARLGMDRELLAARMVGRWKSGAPLELAPLHDDHGQGAARRGRSGRAGFDPIIGQTAGDGARRMDEPFPNYPAGRRRTILTIPEQFVKLSAAAYFFMPSIAALRTVLTS